MQRGWSYLDMLCCLPRHEGASLFLVQRLQLRHVEQGSYQGQAASGD